MKTSISALLCLLWLMACQGLTVGGRQVVPAAPVGGPCDGCMLMYAGMPATLSSYDTSAGWQEGLPKLKISGTVYQADGRTPAPDVVLYYWHTDTAGLYRPGNDPQAGAHGYLRGWVKTDALGRYSIYTLRPAPYPNDVLPAHIHMLVKEPGLANEYYIDDIVFTADPLVAGWYQAHPEEKRGGSGLIQLSGEPGMQFGQRDVVLGMNVPDYPAAR